VGKKERREEKTPNSPSLKAHHLAKKGFKHTPQKTLKGKRGKGGRGD